MGPVSSGHTDRHLVSEHTLLCVHPNHSRVVYIRSLYHDENYHEIQRIILDADRSALTEVWRYEAAHLLVLWVFGANNVHTSLSVLSEWSAFALTGSQLTF